MAPLPVVLNRAVEIKSPGYTLQQRKTGGIIRKITFFEGVLS